MTVDTPTTDDPGGVDQPDPGGNPGTQEPKREGSSDKVSYESYQKVLDEKKALKQRLDAIEADADKRKEQSLREKEQFKELSEKLQADLEAANSKLANHDQRYRNALKVSAFSKALDGQIPDKYWNLIDLEQIKVEGEGDELSVDEGSVQQYVETFKEQFPEVIIKPQTADLPPNSPNGSGGSALTVEQYKAMALDPKVSKKELWEAKQRVKGLS